MAKKVKKNKRNVGGWRIGPNSIKTGQRKKRKNKKKTRPVQLNRTGPVQQTGSREPAPLNTPSPSFLYPLSLSTSPLLLRPDTHPRKHVLLFIAISLLSFLSLPRSLFSSTTPSTHGFPQNRNHQLTHHLWQPPSHVPPSLASSEPSTHTNTRRRVKIERGGHRVPCFGYKRWGEDAMEEQRRLGNFWAK